uniref:BTB domain-containing protein n=1 Tax=Meloidogyne javanica TaxID=6303 RepID=A0A915LYJ2_MELJA
MKTISLSIQFQIYNFDKICDTLQYKRCPLHLTSPRHSHLGLPNVGWELVVHKVLSSNEVEIWLCQMGPRSLDDSVNTKYHIYAIKGNQQIDIARSKSELESQENLGYTIIPLSKIIDHGANLGLLDLNCDIEADCYNPTENLKNKYQKINEIIKAHRCVLAENSQVFRTMFEQTGMIDSQKVWRSHNHRCFSRMCPCNVAVFYSGCLPSSITCAHDVFAIAHKYEVEPLKYECEIIISSQISDKNFLQYCEIISLYGSPTVEKVASFKEALVNESNQLFEPNKLRDRKCENFQSMP